MPEVFITKSEHEVLLGICEGLSAAQIGFRTYRTENTVKTLMRKLYEKLEVHDARSAVVKAWQVELLQTCPMCRRPRQLGSNVRMAPVLKMTTLRPVYSTSVPNLPVELPPRAQDDPVVVKIGEKPRKPTLRMIQILRLVANGYGNIEIAQELKLSENTVRTHMMRTFRVLGASSRGHAVAIAFAKGYLKPEDVRECDGKKE